MQQFGMTNVEFPEMRLEVISALRALSDRHHQDHEWGVYDSEIKYFDDLSLNVHILYDDSQVLPNPQAAVGTVIFRREVRWLESVHAQLGPMIDDLANRPDSDYLADPRWPLVVEAAKSALENMERTSED